MKILIADDHAIVRSGLRRILELELPNVSVGEASSRAELTTKLSAQRWDVVILDVSLGADNGLDALPEIKRAAPQTPVIVLSMYGDRQFVTRALSDGASAYLTKEQAGDDELFRAIRAVTSGRRFLGEALASEIADRWSGDRPARPHEALSARELEVFLLLGAARSVSEIAERLRLSVKTVSTYRTRVLEKLGLETNAELMQYALRNGLTR